MRKLNLLLAAWCALVVAPGVAVAAPSIGDAIALRVDPTKPQRFEAARDAAKCRAVPVSRRKST
jgi:hypothetical protein